MSQEAVGQSPLPCSGFYGKLPSRGDFVVRRLPREFISPWDTWLQAGIASSREQLTDKWLDIYLTSPLWRFALSPGLCGLSSWAGVLMPSVDRVGRYFPLTLAAPIANNRFLPYFFLNANRWFERLEELALKSLDDDFDLDQFDQQLKELEIPLPSSAGGHDQDKDDVAPANATGKLAFQIRMGKSDEPSDAFIGLGVNLLDKFLPGYSLWQTDGSDMVEASLIACEGLPPINAYFAMLNGEWNQRVWQMRSSEILLTREQAKCGEKNLESIPDTQNTIEIVPPDGGAVSTNVWTSSGSTTTGKVRSLNEDAFLEQSAQRLWVVADGMGGHEAGNLASQAIVDSLQDMPVHETLDTTINEVRHRLTALNRKLRVMAEERFHSKVIGSTVVALMGNGEQCAFLWAGDSRLYLYRDGVLVQLTRDHSLSEALIGQDGTGQIDLGQGINTNIITRAVGAEDHLLLDLDKREVVDGDIFLLCSDGLIKELTSDDIEGILDRESIADSSQVLIDIALERGARDNVTAIVAEYKEN